MEYRKILTAIAAASILLAGIGLGLALFVTGKVGSLMFMVGILTAATILPILLKK